jgi:hypothetical protein
LEAAAGPLYLVTGHDKSDNWCLGSYSNAVSGTAMSLTFAPTDVVIGETVQYSPRVTGSIDTRTHRPRGDNPPNQCIFIRGYKLTLCTNLMEKIFVGQVKVSDIVPPKSGNGHGFFGARGTTRLGRWVSWLVGGNGGRIQSRHDEPHVHNASDGTGVMVEGFPDFPEVRHPGSTCLPSSKHFSQPYHPSNVINRHLLENVCAFTCSHCYILITMQNPNAQVAMTHDDVWRTIIQEVQAFISVGWLSLTLGLQ